MYMYTYIHIQRKRKKNKKIEGKINENWEKENISGIAFTNSHKILTQNLILFVYLFIKRVRFTKNIM